MPAPTEVPARADRVRGLALVEVTGDDQRRVWNELMQREHPRGAARHVGAQLRYLLVSDHGVLGALGFAASALTLAARDAFIGWDADLRCRNLASKALGLCLRRLPDDFQRRYGYRPLLVETFVEKDRHAGTSLAAANWLRVGETAGRGRFAAPATRVPVKAVYLYPLARNWRTQLGVAAPSTPPALGPGEGLARDQWAAHEFGSAPLGDVRWSKRLVKSAQIQSEAPTKSFLGAAQKDLAAVKGHYRLIDQPADSAVTPENILAPHRQRTLRRMQGQSAVLCIQDGTDLNFAEHGGCVGLGQIGKNSNAQGTLGLHMHSTLVVNGEGIPLGVPHIQYQAPDGQAQKGKPLQERKTWRWIRGLRACAELAGKLDGVRPVSVMDRGADVFALFAEQRRLGTVALLVRAKHNRSLGKDVPKLFASVRAVAAQARLEIHVGRLSARRGSRGQKGREAAPGAGRAGGAALAGGGVAGPGEGRGGGAADPGARAGGDRAGRGGAAGMVPADDAGGGVAAGRGTGAGMVPATVAHRGLAPGAEVGLQGGVPGASDGGADRAGGDDQRGDRLATSGDDAAGPRPLHRDGPAGGLLRDPHRLLQLLQCAPHVGRKAVRQKADRAPHSPVKPVRHQLAHARPAPRADRRGCVIPGRAA